MGSAGGAGSEGGVGAAGGAGSEGGAILASRAAGVVGFTLSSHCTEEREGQKTSLFETRHTRLGIYSSG